MFVNDPAIYLAGVMPKHVADDGCVAITYRRFQTDEVMETERVYAYKVIDGSWREVDHAWAKSQLRFDKAVGMISGPAVNALAQRIVDDEASKGVDVMIYGGLAGAGKQARAAEDAVLGDALYVKKNDDGTFTSGLNVDYKTASPYKYNVAAEHDAVSGRTPPIFQTRDYPGVSRQPDATVEVMHDRYAIVADNGIGKLTITFEELAKAGFYSGPPAITEIAATRVENRSNRLLTVDGRAVCPAGVINFPAGSDIKIDAVVLSRTERLAIATRELFTLDGPELLGLLQAVSDNDGKQADKVAGACQLFLAERKDTADSKRMMSDAYHHELLGGHLEDV